jgi:20S proteasome subunit alpha 7
MKVSAGLVPDGRHFVSRARDEAASWRRIYKGPIPLPALANRLGGYVQAYTLYSSVRPFGVTSIVGGWDLESESLVDGEVGCNPKCGSSGKVKSVKAGSPGLYMIEPSGLYWVRSCRFKSLLMVTDSSQGYYGAATGKGRQAAKAELEKLDPSSGSLELHDGVREAARIIYIAHEDSKDKDFELEMTWISSIDGPTKGRHEEVPTGLIEDAKRAARKALEREVEDDERPKSNEGERMEE